MFSLNIKGKESSKDPQLVKLEMVFFKTDYARISPYFSEVSDPCVTGRCLHLLSDILLLGLCTYLTGGTDNQDMRLFGFERGSELGDMLSLPNGIPSGDTFERVFKSICPSELENCLYNTALDIDYLKRLLKFDALNNV